MEEEDIPDGESSKPIRNTLVKAIATNIFDALKTNENITQILTEVIQSEERDKEALLKNLMTTVNTTLQDTLLNNKERDIATPASEYSLPGDAESVLSSTISTEAFKLPQSETDLAEACDIFEAAHSDFIYQSFTKVESKNFEN